MYYPVGTLIAILTFQKRRYDDFRKRIHQTSLYRYSSYFTKAYGVFSATWKFQTLKAGEQLRGNYFWTGRARPRAPKSGTRNKILRWNWNVIFVPKRSVPQKKKSLRRIRSVF